jgi:hypothetical protein
MGLDAMVRCRCWEDGHTTEPPVPRDRIRINDDHDLELAFPHLGRAQDYDRFSRWMAEEACPHRDMAYAQAPIADWNRYNRFLRALERAGLEHFPVLDAALPAGGRGTTPPERARAALHELEYFVHEAELGESTTLVDGDHGTTLGYWDGGGGEVWAHDPWRLGFDRTGFFVRNAAVSPAKEVFRSRHFTQEVAGDRLHEWEHEWAVRLTLEWLPRQHHSWVVRLSDEDGPAGLVLPLSDPIAATQTQMPDGRWRWDGVGYFPRRLRVVTAPATPEQHASVIDGLTTVFRASAEIGQPVQWY